MGKICLKINETWQLEHRVHTPFLISNGVWNKACGMCKKFLR